jgi:hypothetical protein
MGVREMLLEEVGVVIDYFHGSSAEHLEMFGVDPTRLPDRAQWRQMYEVDFAQPIERRRSLLVLWQSEAEPIGFSSVDKIVPGPLNFHQPVTRWVLKDPRRP